MFASIRDFFTKNLAADGTEPDTDKEHALRLAAAALLIEISWADRQADPSEQNTIAGALAAKFGLAPEETRELIRLADDERRNSISYYDFTSLINEQFPYPRKVRLVELMWDVAFADGVIEKHEEHLIRRLAGLLHVEHSDFIDAKIRARSRRQAESSPEKQKQ